MAGALLAVGVLVCTTTLSTALVTAGAASVFSQRVAGAADAAALAAADAASGAVAGEPCARASQIAAILGAHVGGCRLDGPVATVIVSAPFGPFSAAAAARAGPPP